MTVTERALFGNVEIQRMDSEWRELRRNLIPDPSMRLDVEITYGVNAAADATRSTAFALFGPHSLRVVSDGGDYFGPYAYAVPVEAGKVYTASLHVLYAKAAGPALAVRIDWRNANGFIRTTHGEAFTPTLTEWTRGHVTGQAPAGATMAAVTAYSNAAPAQGFTAYYDGWMVEQTDELRPYFDPTVYPSSALTRARWAGAEANSQSVIETRVTEHLHAATSLTFRRGAARSALGLKTDVGLLSFQLHNSEDPLRGGSFEPGQEIVCSSRVDGTMRPLFTGRVTDVAGDYPLNKSTGHGRTVTTVTVADAVKVHGETPRYGVAIGAGFETFEARISRLAGSALAPILPPVEGAPREVYAL